MRKPRTNPHRGSHLPVLMKLVNLTTGPIAELGCGMYSSPYLHWACFPSKRKLFTFEDQPEWFEFINQFGHPRYKDFHTVYNVHNWDDMNVIEQNPWSIAFIDHDNKEGRTRDIEAARFAHAEYVVCHDAENHVDHKYHYTKIYKLFKYRWKYTAILPYTIVFSNFHDLSNFSIG